MTRSACAVVLSYAAGSGFVGSFCRRQATHPLGASKAALAVSKGVNILFHIRSQHWLRLNCSAVFLSPLRNRLRFVNHVCACVLVRRNVIWCPLSTTRPTAHSQSGRLVTASRRRCGSAHKEAPPVVNQRPVARRHLAARLVLGYEPTLAPLVLPLVIHVRRVGPLSLQVRDAQKFFVHAGHHNWVFILGGRTAFRQQWPAQLVCGGRLRSPFPLAAQHRHATFDGPTGELQLPFRAFPSVDGGLPPALRLRICTLLFDARALAQSEEIPLLTRFAFGQLALVSVAGVPAYQPRAALRRQAVPDAPEISPLMRRGGVFARTHLHIHPRQTDADCLQELRWMYERRDVEEARRDLGQSLEKCSHKHPRLCAWVKGNMEETWTFYRLPLAHHKHLKSTNF